MPEEAKEDLFEELEDKGYFIVWDLDERMP